MVLGACCFQRLMACLVGIYTSVGVNPETFLPLQTPLNGFSPVHFIALLFCGLFCTLVPLIHKLLDVLRRNLPFHAAHLIKTSSNDKLMQFVSHVLLQAST
jgi:hypothetical protein